MDFLTTQESAERWGISPRQVQRLIAAGRIPEARRHGRAWLIPADAAKPADLRAGGPPPTAQAPPPFGPLPYNIPNFLLSPFYSAPGTADELIAALDNAEAQTLGAALLAYYRGQNREAERLAAGLLAGSCSFETQVGCTLTLATCARYSGSVHSWNRARARLLSLSRQRPDSQAVIITEAALSGVLYMREAPEWLQKGRFIRFHPVSYPVLGYLYAKWLLMQKRYDALLAAVEPLIAAAHACGCLLSELYLHIIIAVAYRISGDEKSAAQHLETALDLALPDKLYGALAEYRRQLGTALDEALKRRDNDAYQRVRETYERLAAGFTVLHNAVTGAELTNELTLREFEIASLSEQGESNAAIARRLSLTVGSVKSYFNTIYQKLGVDRRDDLSKYLV